MLRRLTVIGSMLLAACVPVRSPAPLPSGYYNKEATRQETADWAAAQRVNTADAYRAFVNRHPKSRYAPAAIEKIRVIVAIGKPTIRNVARRGVESGGGRERSY